MKRTLALLILLIAPAVGRAGDFSLRAGKMEQEFTITVRQPEPAKALFNATLAPVQVSCRSGWASGTAIAGAPAGKTYVVSNYHVVTLPNSGGSVRSDGKTYSAKIVALGTGWGNQGGLDLAILLVDGDLPIVPLADHDPSHGTAVTLRGNGVNTSWDMLRSGKIGPGGKFGQGSNIITSPGDSGSGLINKNGELVGVVWGGDGRGSVGHPVSQVRGLLDKAVAKQKAAIVTPKHPAFGGNVPGDNLYGMVLPPNGTVISLVPEDKSGRPEGFVLP